MDDPALVRRVQRVGDLTGDIESVFQRNRTTRDAIRQCVPVDEFEHQRAEAVALLESVDGRDVRMVERGQQPRLALEAGEPVRIGREEARQDLDRDVAPELRVAGAVHLAHPARTNGGLNFVRTEASTGWQGHREGFSGLYSSGFTHLRE